MAKPKATRRDTIPTKKPSKGRVSPSPQREPEGATDTKVGDLTGPGAGYDDEPEQVKDKGGVA